MNKPFLVNGQESLPELPAEALLARGALVLLLLAAIYLLLGLGIYRFWRPDAAFYQDLFATTIISPATVLPEPQEKRLFMVVVFTGPMLALGLWQGLGIARVANQIQRFAPLIGVAATLSVVTLAMAALMAENPFPEPVYAAGGMSFAQGSRTNAGFYFYGTFVYEHPWLYATMMFPCVLWLLTSPRVRCLLDDRRGWANLAILSFAAMVGLWMLASETFRFPYTFENRYDFNAVFNPMVQVYHGTQLLTNHATSIYGLYPQFLLPLFRVFGLSVGAFSGTMAVLAVACFGILLLLLWAFIDNRLILLGTFAAIVFYTFCYPRTVNAFDPYFANIPIRLITTMAALGLSLWCRQDSGRLKISGALALLACGTLWCPDFGLISYFAFTLFLGYLRVDPRQLRHTAFALGEVLGLSLAMLAGVCGSYLLIMRLAYGVAPDLTLIFRSINIYSNLGMNMLPMPLLHPWNLLALTFFSGLLAVLPPLLCGTQGERSARLFLLTILGIGAFSYYQGRSHNWNLLMVLPYAIALWGIFADWLSSRLVASRQLLLPFAVLIFVLGTALPQLVYAWRPLSGLITESEGKAANLATQQRIEKGAEFVRRRTVPGEQVVILTDPSWQGLYHSLAQRGAAFHPDYMDLILQEDYSRLLAFLRTNTSTRIFFEIDVASPFNPQLSKPIMALLQCCYSPVNADGTMLELGRVGEEQCRSCLEDAGSN